MPPPAVSEIIRRIEGESPERLVHILTGLRQGSETSERYLPWDDLRRRKPPGDLSPEEWWLCIKLTRNSMRRPLPLLAKDGSAFSYALPDVVLRSIESVNRSLSGTIAVSEQVTDPGTRDRYLVSSLIEEAITSSQLEGASTSRVVAKEMLRTGRRPVNRSERMIHNNYAAMRRVTELTEERFTPETVLELHRIVTAGTLDDPSGAGRLQTSDDQRVAVLDPYGEVLHSPPPAAELPERLERLCSFANADDAGLYLPPVLRAITIHFMIGYDHPFEDGNGRTARALFYWSMLQQGYWLTEFLVISEILKKAPARYARSFLHTEQDDNDLTYFHVNQLDVIERATRQLHDYLKRKMAKVREFQNSLALRPGRFNHRQLALLEHAVRDSSAQYTAHAHAAAHNVVVETARQDLIGLERMGLLRKARIGKANVWFPIDGLTDALRDGTDLA
jgi:Fic family protein